MQCGVGIIRVIDAVSGAPADVRAEFVQWLANDDLAWRARFLF
jgi:hypothetical protein